MQSLSWEHPYVTHWPEIQTSFPLEQSLVRRHWEHDPEDTSQNFFVLKGEQSLFYEHPLHYLDD